MDVVSEPVADVAPAVSDAQIANLTAGVQSMTAAGLALTPAVETMAVAAGMVSTMETEAPQLIEQTINNDYTKNITNNITNNTTVNQTVTGSTAPATAARAVSEGAQRGTSRGLSVNNSGAGD